MRTATSRMAQLLLMLMAILCLCYFLTANMDRKMGKIRLSLTASPANGAVVSLLKPDWRKILQECIAGSCLESGYGSFESEGHPVPLRFAWKLGKPPYSLVLQANGQPDTALSTDSTALDVCNLLVGKDYKWMLRDSLGTVHSGAFKTQREPRLIAFPDRYSAPVNVRDIGGYMTESGRAIRQGQVFRGTAFTAIPEIGIAEISDSNREFLLKELRIKTELDLRYKEQVAATKGSDISPEINWLHYPVNAYNPFDDAMNALFRDTIRCFADESNYPIYVHCSGGVDRTGEVCFLLEAVLGMEEEDMFTDYELSSLSRFPRSRNIQYLQEWLKRIAAFSPQDAEGLSYRAKVENYMLGIGVTREEIEAIRSIMLE